MFFSLISVTPITDGIKLCIGATVKSWSDRRTSYSICIKICTCLLAAGSPNATFVMSSWEWNVPCFGQRRPATSSNALVVAPANFVAGSLEYWLFWTRKSLKGATVMSQPGRNIPGKFAECSLNVAMFRTSREHLENILTENIF